MNINKYIRLLRPFVLGHTIIILIVLCAIGGFDFYKTLLITTSILLIHANAQLSNMIHDIKLDSLNPYKMVRPLVTGEIKKTVAIIILILMIKSSFAIAWLVSFGFFVRALILSTASFVFSLSFFVRRNEYLHAFWMALCRGFLPPWVVLGNDGLNISFMMFFWALALNPAKDVKDVDSDAKFGIKTIAQKGLPTLQKWMWGWLVAFYLSVLVVCYYVSIRISILLITAPFAFSIPKTITLPPAYSDNTMAYDLYWNFMTLHYVLLMVALTF